VHSSAHRILLSAPEVVVLHSSSLPIAAVRLTHHAAVCKCCMCCTCRRLQVRDNKTALANYETQDMGKPIDEAEWDMVSTQHCRAQGSTQQWRCVFVCPSCNCSAASKPLPVPASAGVRTGCQVVCLVITLQDDVAGCFDYYADLAVPALACVGGGLDRLLGQVIICVIGLV
jgi:hypothetical protein